MSAVCVHPPPPTSLPPALVVLAVPADRRRVLLRLTPLWGRKCTEQLNLPAGSSHNPGGAQTERSKRRCLAPRQAADWYLKIKVAASLASGSASWALHQRTLPQGQATCSAASLGLRGASLSPLCLLVPCKLGGGKQVTEGGRGRVSELLCNFLALGLPLNMLAETWQLFE